MRTLALKVTHKRIAAYHASLAEFAKLGVKHETAVRSAFQALLEDCTSLVNKGRADKWKLVPEYSLKTKTGAKITPEGALLDSFRLLHGLWEAKDTADDLDKEIAKKFKLGYPRDNILFQSPTRAVLVQDGENSERVIEAPLEKDPFPFDFVFTFGDVKERFADLFARWFRFCIEQREALGCYTTTVYHNLPCEIRLICLTQALEAFHARRYREDVVFIDRIRRLCVDHQSYIGPVIGDLEVFAKQVRDSRNYYTHTTRKFGAKEMS
jgi:hypothetical protein